VPIAPDEPIIPESSPIKAVCLDIDDTLLDSEAAARQALKELIGNDAAWPVWKRLTDRYYARFLTREITFENMCVERTRAFYSAFGEKISTVEAAKRENKRMIAMQHAWRLFDDSQPCLHWLRSHGLRTAVITNAPSTYQRDKINAIGLGDAFDTIAISAEIGAAKPDPRIFHAACANLHLHPSQVLHIGDRLDQDAIAATQAGMRGIWLNRGARIPPPAGITMINSLAALPELITPTATPTPRGVNTGARPLLGIVR
jgi:putative hydrolase of the HAD superfamily